MENDKKCPKGFCNGSGWLPSEIRASKNGHLDLMPPEPCPCQPSILEDITYEQSQTPTNAKEIPE